MTPKPSWCQLFFAGDWPLKIWLGLGCLGGLWIASENCEPNLEALLDWRFTIRFLVAVLVCIPAGFLVAFLTLAFFPFISVFHNIRIRLNGGPFKEGDSVRILNGPHAGRLATVYSLWQGETVRVRIGPEEEVNFVDNLSQSQLVKEEAPPDAE